MVKKKKKNVVQPSENAADLAAALVKRTSHFGLKVGFKLMFLLNNNVKLTMLSVSR